MEARTGVLGQLATNRKGSSAEFFSAKAFFKRFRMLVGRDRNIKLLKFSHDVFYSHQPSSRLKGGSIGFFRVNTSKV